MARFMVSTVVDVSAAGLVNLAQVYQVELQNPQPYYDMGYAVDVVATSLRPIKELLEADGSLTAAEVADALASADIVSD